MNMNKPAKLLLFDLDGTLLRSDKTLSRRTLDVLGRCRERGILIGISTSRAVHNCVTFLPNLIPDLLIASGGAVIQYKGENIYSAEFTLKETLSLIEQTRMICGRDCEMTVDSLSGHYWNYKVDPNRENGSWGDTTYSDFTDFTEKALKFSALINEEQHAQRLRAMFPDYDFARFEGGHWYKFTKANVTKEHAIQIACRFLDIKLENITAFGDDTPDIGMLRLCGTGIAMGNALEAVKEASDLVIGSNDADGIAEYLETVL